MGSFTKRSRIGFVALICKFQTNHQMFDACLLCWVAIGRSENEHLGDIALWRQRTFYVF